MVVVGLAILKKMCPSVKQKRVCNQNKSELPDQAFIGEVMSAELDEDSWIADCGATNHMAKKIEWYTSFTKFQKPLQVCMGNDSTMNALGTGTIYFEAFVDGEWKLCHMDNVLYTPEGRRNLFSVSSAMDKGLDFHSSKDKCEFRNNGIVKACGIRSGNLLKMLIRVKKPENPFNAEVNVASKESLQIWHERLGHQNKRHVQQFLKQRGVEVEDFGEDFCEACVKGKQHRSVFQTRQQRPTQPGEVFHGDLCGPMECKSLGGAEYFLCFTCDYSRLRFVYFLKQKSETAEKIAEMLSFVKNFFGRSPKAFQCDGGREFDNTAVTQLMKLNGIQFIVTNPYTPEQNGCAERTNRTVVELARTMLLAQGLPKFLWAEAVNTAVYVLNRTGTSRVNGKTPYEVFTGKTVELNKLHIFGTKCFVHIPKEKRKKWDPKGKAGVFVGYSDGVDGYRVWIESENRIIRSKDVIFEPEKTGRTVALLPSELNDEKSKSQPEDEANVFKDSAEVSSSDRQLRNRQQLKKPDRLIEIMLAEINEPKNYTEAITSVDHEHWRKAMEEEMASLKENATWSLEPLPPDRKPITNRWVYRIKRKADGKIDRYKARLVARGFSQQEGVDYNETFSPVARYDTVRAILSVAASEHLHLAQFDVKSAFLNGFLKEEIYMQQPEGFSDGTDRVCKLHKSLYGLKQSPRCWNQRFKDFLVSLGLVESKADPCLFFRENCDDKLIVVLYVDDGLISASKKEDIEVFLRKIQDEFKITTEPVGYFLNINIICQEDGSIEINQESYAKDILRRFNMTEANAVSTPIEQYLQPDKLTNDKPTNAPYREAVGCLMYLAVGTRPDIMFAVSYVSRFLEHPQEIHWSLVKRILKYIKGSVSLGIKYEATHANGRLEIYTDADYASDPATRRSVSGIVAKFCGGAVTWASKRQQCISLSTTESEYVAASEGAREAMWLFRLYQEISSLKSVPVLLVDNSSAIKLAKNPEFHKRSKHIDVRMHYIREKIQEGQLTIEHVPGNKQAGDILTKPLPHVRFAYLKSLLGMC